MTPTHDAPPESRVRRTLQRFREKPLAATVLVFGLIAGPFFTSFAFPEAPLVKHLLGGCIFGFYFALCAVPEQFLEL